MKSLVAQRIASALEYTDEVSIHLDFNWHHSTDRACEELDDRKVRYERTGDYTIVIGERVGERVLRDLVRENMRLRAEVDALRARVQVDRQDVRSVTWDRVDAWLASIGEPAWTAEEIAARSKRFGPQIIDVIRAYSRDVWPATTDSWRILDEMMEVEP